MAYQTGTFTNPDGLLSAIQAFATANGWTQDNYAVDGTGHRLDIHKGSVSPAGVVFTPSGTANGTISAGPTPGSSPVTETWTLICTLAGGNGVATFSVTGSVSGLQAASATAGTAYSVAGLIGFTITAGTNAFALNDKFVFKIDALYLHFRSAVNEVLASNAWYWPPIAVTGVACAISTGYNGGASWLAQPGGSLGSTFQGWNFVGSFNQSASGTYYLFANTLPDMLFCVMQVSPGVFNHIGGGMLTRAGDYLGGEWLTGSYCVDGHLVSGYPQYWIWGTTSGIPHGLVPLPFSRAGGSFVWLPATQVRAVYDAYSGFGIVGDQNSTPLPSQPGALLKAVHESTANAAGSPSSTDYDQRWWTQTPASLNGVSPMFPCELFGRRPSGFFSPLGYAPWIRYINMTNYNGGDEITLGADTWKVFPGYRKDPSAYSFNYGYAVLKQP